MCRLSLQSGQTECPEGADLLAASLSGFHVYMQGNHSQDLTNVEKTSAQGDQKWVLKMEGKIADPECSSTVRVDIAEFYSCSIICIADAPYERSLHESEGIRHAKGWTRS